jgi:cellulose synthase/poly-beta-1,6-N-acetylglucosamine synthase-like glycosyltransferase/glycosyltransferase involved in cell wall biosynthesis
MNKVDIIVPVLNEGENVKSLILRLSKSLAKLSGGYGIIIVDDHSTDNTAKTVKSLSRKYPVTYLLKKGKPGKAFSILEGVGASSAEYVAMIDGDLQYPPEAIPQMLIKAEKEDLGIVIGHRAVHKEGFLRNLVSRVGHFIYAKTILGLDFDTQSGLKLFKRYLALHLHASDIKAWAFDLPLLYTAKELGEKIGNWDIVFHERKNGKSKVNFIKTTIQILATSLNLKFGGKKALHIAPSSEDSMAGAGVMYKRKRFITHTTLHHSKSALVTVTNRQKVVILSLLMLLISGFLINAHSTQIIFLAILSAIYFADVLFGLYLVLKSLHNPPEISFSSKELDDLDDNSLPVYTILSPLYKESHIIPQFLENMDKLDWPKNKLDVILLLEEDDKESIEAVENMFLPEHVRVAVVPDSFPKTKPKACNYGLSIAKGEYVVIYDAEDMPEANQLKKAYLGFQNSGEEVFCLQAKLNYYNPNQNLLTRLFTAEYSLWFDIVLPGLQSIETTIPLGGTSNHFRLSGLKKLEGWDPFNVAEDADLGARLFRNGYKTAIIDSITLEEANSNVGNWIRQRSRWIKGYLQTYLVQMRNPLEFMRQHKRHYFIFQLVSGLRISFMVINPFLWAMTAAYFLLYKYVGPQIEALFPPAVFYIAVTSAVFGNFLYVYYYMIGAAKRGQWGIIKYVFFVPFYWLLNSIGAFMAFYQLVFKPHYWEKTVHGLNVAKKQSQMMERVVNHKYADLAKRGWNVGGVLIFSNMVANVLNFSYSTYLGRTVDLAQLGTVSLINSLFAIATVLTAAYGKTISYKTAYLLGKFGVNVKNFSEKSERSAWIISVFFTIVWLLAIPLMSSYFKTDDVLPFVLFIPAVTTSFVASYFSGFLHGTLKFGTIGVVTVVEAAGKFALAVLIISLGYKDLVYAAVPVSALLTFAVLYYTYRRTPLETVKKDITKEDLLFPLHFFSSSIANKLWGVSFLSFDIILAKYYLSPVEAGQYALLSLSGKIIFFLGNIFNDFIGPFVSKNEGAQISSSKVFKNIFALSSLATFGTYLIIGYFGALTAPLLFGEKVSSIAYLLPFYGIGISFYTLTTSLVNYQQIKKRWVFTFVGLLFSGLQIIWISLNASNLNTFSAAFSQVLVMQFIVVSVLSIGFDNLKTLASNLQDFVGLALYPKEQTENIKNPRILIFNWRDTRHKWSGGAEVYIHEIAKRLVKQNYDVTVFCGNDGTSPRNEKVDGVQVIRRGGFYTVYLWAFLYYVLRLRKYFDVIIDSENGIPFFTPLYANKKIFLLIHHVHQDMFRIKLKPPLSWFGKYLEKQIMPLVYRNTEVITVSPSSKADILEHKITDKDPRVIYNGVNTEVYKPGVKAKNPMVLYLGRLSKQKSLSVFIHSAQKVLEKFPQVEFIIAGDGEDKHRLMKLTKSLNLEAKIKFTGKVSEEEKVDLYQKAWVFVNPSLMEGWGITTIEANACGTPVVASNVAGLRDAVHNPHSGVLVPYGNVDEFSKYIVKLINNKGMRQRMVKDSIAWAKKYSWDSAVKQITELL